MDFDKQKDVNAYNDFMESYRVFQDKFCAWENHARDGRFETLFGKPKEGSSQYPFFKTMGEMQKAFWNMSKKDDGLPISKEYLEKMKNQKRPGG